MVAAVAACGGGGSGDGTASAGSSSSSSGGAATEVVTTGGLVSAGPTSTGDTGGATQGAEEGTATPTTGPVPTSAGTTTGSSGPGETTGAVVMTTGGDTSTGGEPGSSSGGEDTGSSSGGAVDTGSSSDESTSEMGPVEGLWLVMIEDTSSPTRLYKIDLLDGHATLLCTMNTSDDYNTSTFGREGTLYAANANTKSLESIDPCTCARTVLGPTNVTQLPGITADQGLGLYGLESAIDKLVTLDTKTGAATAVGSLGLDWGTGGLTWSDDLKDTFAINGNDDKLYTIDHLTGKATAFVQTNYNFGSVGVEWHPKVHEIYACSNPAELLHVAQKDGDVTVVGKMMLENQQAHCDNLAAPWVPIACVEDK